MEPITANAGLVRRLNESLILDALRRGPASRADLARITGLTTGTVSNLVRRLEGRGLVREVGRGQSSGGRRPIVIELNGTVRYALGAQITPEFVQVVLVDLAARPVASKIVTGLGSGRPDAALDLVAALAREVLAESGLHPGQVLGIGAALPATIDVEKGVCYLAPNLPAWQGAPVKSMLEQRLGLPAFVDNDANSAAHGELWAGTGSRYRDFTFIYADYGIGAGFVFQEEVYRGHNYGAGEIGHSVVDAHGEICHCGRRGCLATVAAGKYLIARDSAARDSAAQGRALQETAASVADLLGAAGRGERWAVERLSQAGRYLGVALANLVNVYSPQAVILGGRLALESDAYRQAAVEVARSEIYPPLRGRVDFVPSVLGEAACAVGAATFVLKSFFQPYRVVRPAPVGERPAIST